jgi:hypothetical protein
MADVQPSKLIVWKICTLAHPKLSRGAVDRLNGDRISSSCVTLFFGQTVILQERFLFLRLVLGQGDGLRSIQVRHGRKQRVHVRVVRAKFSWRSQRPARLITGLTESSRDIQTLKALDGLSDLKFERCDSLAF